MLSVYKDLRASSFKECASSFAFAKDRRFDVDVAPSLMRQELMFRMHFVIQELHVSLVCEKQFI